MRIQILNGDFSHNTHNRFKYFKMLVVQMRLCLNVANIQYRERNAVVVFLFFFVVHCLLRVMTH